jgi:hypothetical protein
VLGRQANRYTRRIDGRRRGLTGFEYLHVLI